MSTMFRDKAGNVSSFRVVWAISVLTIFGTWALSSFTTGVLQVMLIDGITMGALFGASGLKTYTERNQ